jgi:hypothetical protein
LLQELEHELLQNKLEKQKLKDKRKAKKRVPEELEFVGGSKKLKVKMGKEFEERNKKLKEKKKFREQKESIKKVRKVRSCFTCNIHAVNQYLVFIWCVIIVIIYLLRLWGSQCSSVDTVMGCRLDGPGSVSRVPECKMFPFFATSRLTLRPIHPPIQWVMGV